MRKTPRVAKAAALEDREDHGEAEPSSTTSAKAAEPVTTALKEAPEQQLRVDGNRRSALRRIAAYSGG